MVSPAEFTMHLSTLSIPAELIASECWSIAAWDPADQPGEHLHNAMVMYRRESRYNLKRRKNRTPQTEREKMTSLYFLASRLKDCSL